MNYGVPFQLSSRSALDLGRGQSPRPRRLPTILALFLATILAGIGSASAQANQPPTVSLTAPLADTVLTLPATLILAATAHDPDGFVTKVEFYDGSTYLGETTTAPFTLSWSAASPGIKTLRARAIDNSGAVTDSNGVSIRLLASLPFLADFEASEGYSLGSLNGQHGWVVSNGSAQIVATGAAHGTQNVDLSPGAIATEVEQEFGALDSSAPIVYVDFFAKPVAGADYASSTLFEVDAARVAFVKIGLTGQFAALDGDGLGSGTWNNVGATLALEPSDAVPAWQRLTVRLDYTAKTYDLYLNNQLVAIDLKFRLNVAAGFTWFSLKGHPTDSVSLDDIYAGASNPLFTDLDSDGLDDNWEIDHGLNPGINDRDIDTDADGLTNIQEYLFGTNPILSDTDGDGLSDRVERDLGTNPTVADNLGPILDGPRPRLHLRADLGVVTDENGRVFFWKDTSGNGNNASTGETSERPWLESGGPSGYPAIHFNGAQNVRFDDFMSTASSGEIIAVVRVLDKTSAGFTDVNNKLWNFNDIGTGYNKSMPEDNSYYHYNNFGMVDSVLDAQVECNLVSDYHIIDIASDQIACREYINNAQISEGMNRMIGFGVQPEIGCRVFYGDFAEILVYDHSLSAQERDRVYRYLRTKYFPHTFDVDGDGLPDEWEMQFFGSLENAAADDPDTDGLTNIEEYSIGTSPLLRDTDGDGLSDRVERELGSNPLMVDNPGPILQGPAPRLHLRADFGVVADQDGRISVWKDTSGNGNDAYAGDYSEQPWLVADGPGGNPVVHFDGDQCIRFGNLMGGASSGEVIAVVRVQDKTSAGFQDINNKLWNFNDSGTGYIKWNLGDNTYYHYNTFGIIDSGLDAQVSTSLVSNYHVLDLSSDQNACREYINGVEIAEGFNRSIGFGAQPEIGCKVFYGEFAEVLVYDHSLSSQERDEVHRYLAQKYAPELIPVANKPTLHVYPIAEGGADLLWSSEISDTVYRRIVIERSIDGSGFTGIAVATQASGFTDTGLLAGHQYAYRILIDTYGGRSPYSDIVSIDAGVASLPLNALRLWLRSTAGVSTSGSIERWADQSGHHNDATQEIKEWRPLFSWTGIDDKPAIQFGNTNHTGFMLPDFISDAHEGEIFIITRLRDLSHPYNALHQFGSGSGTVYSIDQAWTDFGSTSTESTTLDTSALVSTHIYNASITEQGFATMRINGALKYERSSQQVSFPHVPVLGNDWLSSDSYSEAYNGYISEVMLFDRTLNSEERLQVHRYVAHQYNIELAALLEVPTLNATPANTDSVDLNWTPPLVSEQLTISIERKVGGGEYQIIESSYAGTSYTDFGVNPGNNYTYRMRFSADGLFSAYSNECTVGTPAVGIPKNGIRLWLRASAGLPSSGLVSVWKDQAPGHNDAFQSSPGNRPVVIATNTGTGRAVRFDLDRHTTLDLPNFMAGAVVGEVFAVVKRSAISSTVGLWSFGNGLSNRYPDEDGQLRDSFAADSAPALGVPQIDLTQYHLYNVGGYGKLWFVNLNGVPQYSRDSNIVRFRSNPVLGNGDGAPFDGEVAEILVYDRVLSPVEREQIGHWLAIRHGITSATPPPKPELIAYGVDGATVDLAWFPSANGPHPVTMIERTYPGGVFSTLAVLQGNVTQYVDNNVSLGSTYVYRVQVASWNGESPYSNEVTVRTPRARIPTDGLVTWLRAGATGSNLGMLALWADKSRSKNDAIASNSAHLPQLVRDLDSGRLAVHFDPSTGGSLRLPNILGNTSSGEAFAVIRRGAMPDPMGIWAFGTGMGSRYPGTNGLLSDDFGSSNAAMVPAAGVDLTKYHIYNISVGSIWSLRLDGKVLDSHVQDRVTFRTNPIIGDGDGARFGGDIAEIVVFNRQLTDLERANVTACLAAHYELHELLDPLDGVDSDGDGISDVVELARGTAPNDYYNSLSPTITIVNGNGQSGGPGAALQFPLTIRVMDQNGTPLKNAPITVSVPAGGVGLAGQGPFSRSVALRTDSTGVVTVYWQVANPAADGGDVATITAGTMKRQAYANRSEALDYTAIPLMASSNYPSIKVSKISPNGHVLIDGVNYLAPVVGYSWYAGVLKPLLPPPWSIPDTILDYGDEGSVFQSSASFCRVNEINDRGVVIGTAGTDLSSVFFTFTLGYDYFDYPCYWPTNSSAPVGLSTGAVSGRSVYKVQTYLGNDRYADISTNIPGFIDADNRVVGYYYDSGSVRVGQEGPASDAVWGIMTWEALGAPVISPGDLIVDVSSNGERRLTRTAIDSQNYFLDGDALPSATDTYIDLNNSGRLLLKSSWMEKGFSAQPLFGIGDGRALAINNGNDILAARSDGTCVFYKWHPVSDSQLPGGGSYELVHINFRFPSNMQFVSISSALSDAGMFGGAVAINGQRVPALFVPVPRTAVDRNGDREIQIDAASQDLTSETNPLYVAVNSSHVSETSPVSSFDDRVNGTDDITNFIPLYLDLKPILACITPAPGRGVVIRLKQADAAYNFAYTDLTRQTAYAYLKDARPFGYGPAFLQSVSNSTVEQITANGTQLSAEFLNRILQQDQGVVLLESRAPSDKPIVVSLEANGMVLLEIPVYISSKSISLAVDMNHDGVVSFGAENGRDQTSVQNPYLFWINDDDDVDDDDPDDSENAPVSTADYTDDKIDGIRDLEDFSRLKIYLGGLQDAVLQGQIQIGLKWKDTTGSPSLKVWRNLSPNGGTEYLTDVAVARQHLTLRGPGLVQGATSYIIPPQYWQDVGLSSSQPYGNLLFEGCTVGKGQLVITLHKADGTVIGEGPGVWIDLKNIKSMYERVKATADGAENFPFPYNHVGSDPVPAPAMGWTPDPNGFPFEPAPGESATYIVSVHGWNQTYERSTMYAETMFKRMWHRGYKGRFVRFRWPTFTGLTTYNDSEYRAWKCGVSLKQYLDTLPSTYTVNLVAHSMGNIVAGSALEKGASVANYALLNAAVPAICYDTSGNVVQTGWGYVTPNDDPDSATVSLSYQSRLANVSGNLVNFFLPADSALSAWELNNDSPSGGRFPLVGTKPHQWPEGSLETAGYRYQRTASAGQKLRVVRVAGERILASPDEAMGFAVQAPSLTVGADGRTRGAIDDWADMTAYGFDSVHSAEFLFTIHQTRDFYGTLLLKLGVAVQP